MTSHKLLPLMKSIPVWRQIQKETFTQLEPLSAYLELSGALRERLLSLPRFPLKLPRRLASKIIKNTLDDPILRQFVPLQEETLFAQGFTPDPLCDRFFQKTKKILHKYKGRALLLATSACAMHCRFCFRQNFSYETDTPGFAEEIAYIQNDSSLSEIILSGGDPLSLSDATIFALLTALGKIPHIQRIRFHTRFPIGIPERIDPSFLNVLSLSTKQIFFVIHCNHPRELDDDVISSLKKIKNLGIPILNQSVLIKGVNDDPDTLLTLCESLLNIGILPYYLHELDPVEGSFHFSVSREKGTELVRHVQTHLSGCGVPRLVREEPGQPSKTWIRTTDPTSDQRFADLEFQVLDATRGQ